MRGKQIILVTIGLILSQLLLAGSLPNIANGFKENKGQVLNQHGQVNKKVRYSLHLQNLSIQLRDKGISYELFEGKTVHRVDLNFIGANQNARFKNLNKTEGEFRYSSKENPSVCYKVNAFKKVVYEELYKGIDLECYIDRLINGNEVFKYNFIIHPGANPSQILFKVQAETPAQLDSNGQLRFGMGAEMIVERIPLSYLLSSDDKPLNAVEVSYLSKGKGIFGFSVPSYDKSKTLVIDPIVWSTYYGGGGADIINGVVCDPDSNMYLVGTTSSGEGIASSGAHNSTFSGSQDAFIAKFNKAGHFVWGTYYGGVGNDIGNGIAFNSANKLIIVGSTLSQTGISSIGAFQTSIGGQSDGFIASFDTTGRFNWGTYFGGNQNDYITSLAIDPVNNQMSFSGYTNSGNLPVVGASSHQVSIAGFSDFFVTRFNPLGYPIWATYYGGTGSENTCKIASDVSGKIYLVGGSSSSTGISTSNAYKSNNTYGNLDAVLAIFDSTGYLIYGSFYGTNQVNDVFEGIINDGKGKLFLIGTFASKDSVSTPGSYKPIRDTSSNKTEGVVACFDTSGARLWATYYGGNGNDFVRSIALSNDNYLFVAGYTQSTIGISTPDAIQTSIADLVDGFYTIFTKEGVHLSGSYLGGNNTDIIWQVYPWSIDEFVLFGQSWSDSFITAPGGYIVPKPSTAYDAFITKIAPDKTVKIPCGFNIGFTVNGLIQCERNNNFIFTDTTTVPDITTRRWEFGDGNTSSNVIENYSYTFGTINYFNVKLYLESAGGCKDSMVKTVYLIPNPKPNSISGNSNVKRLDKETYTVTANTGYQYQWWTRQNLGTVNNLGSSAEVAWTKSWGTDTLYALEQTGGGCYGDTLMLVVNISPASGEEELEMEEIIIFPNPAKDYIELSGVGSTTKYTISNIQGAVLLSGNMESNSIISLNELKAGYYLVKLVNELGSTKTIKIAISR
jgi:predicted SpoU family rRNA methylase